MKSILTCSCFMFLCLSVATADAQTSFVGPQPDDLFSQQSADDVQPVDGLLIQLDKHSAQELRPHELRGLLKAIILQMSDMQREISSLKQQCEQLQRNQTVRQISRKPVILMPADGGVYGGKYYPPAQSASDNK